MNEERTTLVEFVARGALPGEWKMVLVEEGPWSGAIEDELRRIQERMYGCIDAILDGKLAGSFPESKGERVVIQLDCYEVPRTEVDEFFARFSSGVLSFDDYRKALECSEFVSSIGLEVNFDGLSA